MEDFDEAEEANEDLKSLFQMHETIILTGGSGMFGEQVGAFFV